MINKVVETMRAILSSQIVDCLAGTINYNQEKLSLGSRGGVYGFAIKLDKEERVKFFNNYNEKKTSKNKVLINKWMSLGDDYYPLYWGKDSNLGFRLFDHIHTRGSTGTLQLDSRVYLRQYIKENKIIYGAVLCNDISGCEKKLRSEYPDIFRTHTGNYDY